MNVTEANMEPTLFDLRASEAELQQPPETNTKIHAVPDAQPDAAVVAKSSEVSESAAESSSESVSESAAENAEESAADKRKRIEKQLDALKRKEAELRRALLIAEHPELGDAIRVIEGRAFAVTRAEEKAGNGLSKSELRRRETIDKKLGSLREKRAELDSQISVFEEELKGLGSEQMASFAAEKREAMEQLLIALSTHAPTLSAVGLDANSLVPERWLPEIEAIAREVSARS